MFNFTLTWAELPGGPNDGSIGEPTSGQLDEILSQGNEGFAILSSGEEDYIQTSAGTGKGNEPIAIEYRAGNADAHFTLDEEVLGSHRLKQLFRSYLADPAAISRQGRWKPLTW